MAAAAGPATMTGTLSCDFVVLKLVEYELASASFEGDAEGCLGHEICVVEAAVDWARGHGIEISLISRGIASRERP